MVANGSIFPRCVPILLGNATHESVLSTGKVVERLYGTYCRAGTGIISAGLKSLVPSLLALFGSLSHAQFVEPLQVQRVPAGVAKMVNDGTTSQDVMRLNASALRINPLVELNERHTDNVTLTKETDARSDWVTELMAGVQIGYRGSKATATLDYRVNRLFHRGQSANLDSTQRQLNSSVQLEAIERWLFIDSKATIAQLNRSAFGTANIAGVTSMGTNSVETTSYQFAPSVRGDFANAATYLLRVNGAKTHTGDSQLPDSISYEWTGILRNAASGRRIGWAVDGNSLRIENNVIGRKQDSRMAAAVTYELATQLHLSTSVGMESSNLDGPEKRNTNTRGLGAEWSPSSRTQISAVTQKRFFGNDHLVVIGHRSRLTSWRFSSSKEVAFSTGELATSGRFSVSSLLLDLLASAIPDPKARNEAAQQRLQQTGLSASSGIQDGFLSVRPILQNRQEVSVALVGIRNTLTIAAGRREQRVIDVDAFSPNSASALLPESVLQKSANAAWAYRLSPASTLKLVLSHLNTRGLFAENLTSTQQLQSLFFVTRIGPRATASIGAQRIRFDSTSVTSFRENAFASSLAFRY